MYVSIGQAADMVGVSVSSMRRWEKQGRIKPDYYTPGGHKRFSLARLKTTFGLVQN